MKTWTVVVLGLTSALCGCPTPHDLREAPTPTNTTNTAKPANPAAAGQRAASIPRRPRAALNRFEVTRNDAMGYALLLPAGSALEHKTTRRHTYRKRLERGAVQIHLTPHAATDLAHAVRTATPLGGTALERRAIRGGYLVVKAPRASKQVEVWVFRRTNQRAVTVRVSGPPAAVHRLKTIALSLMVSG